MLGFAVTTGIVFLLIAYQIIKAIQKELAELKEEFNKAKNPEFKRTYADMIFILESAKEEEKLPTPFKIKKFLVPREKIDDAFALMRAHLLEDEKKIKKIEKK